MKSNLKQVVFILILCFCSNTEIFAQLSVYKGLKFKDINEIENFEKISSKVYNLHFALLFIKNEEDEHFLCLSKFQQSDNNPEDFQLRIEQLEAVSDYNKHLYKMQLDGCTLNGKRDNNLVVLCLRSETNNINNFVSAWRVDPKIGTIKPILLNGIKCKNLEATF